MNNRMILVILCGILTFGLMSCSSDDSSTPADPQDPGNEDGVISALSFTDFGATARAVLPPTFTVDAAKTADVWRDGQYALLGKVFSEHEPMSIHRNIDDHDRMMMTIEDMLAQVAAYESEHGELPSGPIAFTDPEHGSGTMTIDLIEATAPVPVPAVCQTVFGVEDVAVDYLLHIECELDAGGSWSSPYFGFSASDDAQVLYYWDVNRDEDETANGSVIFLAHKDVASDSFDIAGATFKPEGPGDEERCNWVYHLTGNAAMEFDYNMGWYSENPEFQLFGCVQGSGNKDVEFGLRYHQYTDTSGWDAIDEMFTSEDIFGPVGDDPYAYIEEGQRSGTIEDYVDASIMYLVDDSPLAEIPNPFAALFQ